MHSSARSQWVQTKDFDRHSWGRAGVYSLAANGTNLFAATPDSGVFLSTDNGRSWTAVNKFSEAGAPKAAYSLAAYDTYLFAGSDSGSIFLSTNGGKTWIQSRNSSSGAGVVDAFGVSGTNIFAGSFGGGVYRSTDKGSNWTVEDSGLVDAYGDKVTDILAFAVNGTNLFAGTDAGGIFLTQDSGRTWAASGLNQTLDGVPAFATSGTNIFAGTAINGLYLSIDDGTSWNAVNSGFPDNIVQLDIMSLYAFGTNIFAASDKGGVFLSTDSGTSWVSVNDGLPIPMGYHYVDAFVVSGGYLYVGTTDTGVWRRPLSEMLPLSAVQEQPSATAPFTAAPNPTRESALLSFTTSSAGSVKIEVFDVLGNKVSSAGFESLFEPGNKAVPVSLAGLPSGTYFARIVTAYGEVQTVKLVKQ